MSMKKSTKVQFLFLLLNMMIAAIISLPVSFADGDLTLKISKVVGTAYSDKKEGTFKIIGTGPDSIVNLTLTFNGTEVYFAEGNRLEFKFDTADYSLGYMNITLWGADGEGHIFSKSEMAEFITSDIGLFIGIGGGVIALISIIIVIIISIRKKKEPPVTIDEIKIERL